MSDLCCGCSCQKSDEPLIETEDGRKWCSDCLRDAWDEMVSAGIVNDFEKLRKRESDYKHQIHTLRQRCESLVRELESLRAERHSIPVVRHFDGINQEPQSEE